MEILNKLRQFLNTDRNNVLNLIYLGLIINKPGNEFSQKKLLVCTIH